MNHANETAAVNQVADDRDEVAEALAADPFMSGPLDNFVDSLADVVAEAMVNEGEIVEHGGRGLGIFFQPNEGQLLYSADIRPRGADVTDVAGNFENDMRKLANQLTRAADAIRESERERRHNRRSLADEVQTMREAIVRHFQGDYTGDFFAGGG